MTEPQSDFWFPAKSYGWGWGLPVKWQGWLVVIGYFGLTSLLLKQFKDQRDLQDFLVYFGAITVIFVVVVYMKGERPAKWRWGGR